MTKTSKHPYLKMHVAQNQHKKTKARFSCLLRHSARKPSGTILVEWEGMKKQESR